MSKTFDPSIMPAPPQPPGGLRFILIGLVLVLILGLGAQWVAQEYQRGVVARELMSRSYQRRIIIADLMSHLKDAETSRQGYLITGDRALLSTYRSALTTIDRHGGQLQALLIAVPIQSSNYHRFNLRLDMKLAQLAGVGAPGVPVGSAAAVRSLREGRGRSLMTWVSVAAAVMMREEDRMIAYRIEHWSARTVLIRRWIWSLVAASAVLASIALALTWRERRSRYRLAVSAHEAAVRLCSIFVGTSDGIVLVGPDGAIEAVNPAVTAMLGHDPATLIGRDLSVMVDVLPPGSLILDRLHIAEGALMEPLRQDRAAHHATGRDVPVDVALGLMPVPSGMHLIAAIRDISGRKVIDRMKDEFIATVSHELRTPLTSIVGALGLLNSMARPAMSDGEQRLLSIAEENSRRLIDLVNDLLDMERMDAGGLQLRDVRVDLASVLRRAVKGGEGMASVKGVELALALPQEPVFVRGDEGRLLQVVTNLLANAIRFSPAGGAVVVAAAGSKDRIVVSVKDRGPGVPESFRDQLFTRFAQYDHGGSAGGTGLGLAISRQIVRAHGGAIWFEPRIGGGACFHFRLARCEMGDRPPRLLICAQDVSVAAALGELADAGACSADQIRTGADARAALRSGGYDAILLDLDSADPIGRDLWSMIRSDGADGEYSVPIAARIDGEIRVGAAGDPNGWRPADPSGSDLGTQIRLARDYDRADEQRT